MEYEESNLSKSFPTKFNHECFKILDWKWFNSRSCVGAVLVWDLCEKRLKGFLGSPTEKYMSEESQVIEIAEIGCSLPSDMVITIFKRYFSQEDVLVNLDKNFRLFMAFTEILDEQ